MYKIAVMGDSDSVLGFKALGLDVYPVDDAEHARKTLRQLAKEDCAIVYMTEQLGVQIPEELARYKDALTPAIILIPGKEGSLGIGQENVTKSVVRAIGADIL
jgi:V/A-type H+-transporting ATPase subunit F